MQFLLFWGILYAGEKDFFTFWGGYIQFLLFYVILSVGVGTTAISPPLKNRGYGGKKNCKNPLRTVDKQAQKCYNYLYKKTSRAARVACVQKERTMNKHEFETLINKEVTTETFDLYNTMYMATPNNVDKATFVSMLNVEAIPESPEAIERRQREAERKAKINAEIAEIKAQINALKEYRKADLENAKYWRENGEREIAEMYNRSAKGTTCSIKVFEQDLARLKACL